MSIIEKLFNGEVLPVEEIMPSNDDYRLLADEIGNGRKHFAALLSAVEKEKFDEWNKYIARYEEMVQYAHFEYGFKLGALIAIEIFMGWQN